MNIIRRLVNSWVNFKVKRKGKLLIEYAREKQFQPAVELFSQLDIQMDLCFAVLACNSKKVESIIKNNYSSLMINFKNMVRHKCIYIYTRVKIDFYLNKNNSNCFKKIERKRRFNNVVRHQAEKF